MKKIFKNSRLIAIAFFTVFTGAAASPAMANNGKDLPVELKFVGSINNQTIFQLNISGTDLDMQNDYTLFIRDEYGNNVYRENIKGENFTKKFLLNTDEIGDDTLQFEIMSKKSKKSVVYEVNRNTRSVEEVVINEVK